MKASMKTAAHRSVRKGARVDGQYGLAGNIVNSCSIQEIGGVIQFQLNQQQWLSG